MTFFQTLHGKLSAALLALFIAVGALLIPLTLFAVRGYTEEVAQQLNRPLAADLAKHLDTQNLLRANFASDRALQAAAKSEIGKLMVLNPDIEIYILDTQGEVLAYSAKAEVLPVERVDLKPLRQFFAGQTLPIRGDDPLHLGGRKVFSAARIPDADGRSSADDLNGFVYIVLGSEAYQGVAQLTERSYALRGILWTMAGALALVFGAGVGLFRVLTRPLRQLKSEMSAFQVQFVAPTAAPANRVATPPAQGEIEALQQNFSALAQCISSHVSARERDEAARRERMGNISHDLRTPLAALQGYLETLQMKDATLSPAERQHYLSTAMRRATRLGTLIAALFELAKLDSSEAKARLEPFSLAELAQDELQQFALAAEQKGVRLQAHFTDDLPMVNGDIALIERALENLLSNALRHTPTGGLVSVRLTPCQQSGRRCVRVEVRDNGEGIAQADLPRIFDRNFRSDHNSEGAGLGLAITKRILELHDETIEVKSERGAGTTFSFRLWAPEKAALR